MYGKINVKSMEKNWSVIPMTTDKMVPFGVVQLAAGTHEGHPQNMGHFRWAQSTNYGILPNIYMLNTFMAQAYDLGLLLLLFFSRFTNPNFYICYL